MKKIVAVIFIYFFVAVCSSEVSAQCAMCKRTAETNYQQQKTAQRKGSSLNHGILYLLSIPYLIGGIGVVVWYKNREKFNQ